MVDFRRSAKASGCTRSTAGREARSCDAADGLSAVREHRPWAPRSWNHAPKISPCSRSASRWWARNSAKNAALRSMARSLATELRRQGRRRIAPSTTCRRSQTPNLGACEHALGEDRGAQARSAPSSVRPMTRVEHRELGSKAQSSNTNTSLYYTNPYAGCPRRLRVRSAPSAAASRSRNRTGLLVELGRRHRSANGSEFATQRTRTIP